MIKHKLLFICCGFFSSVVFADNFKLGYVDVAKIFSTAKPAIALQDALKSKFKNQETELKKLNDKLVQENNQLKTTKNKQIETQMHKDQLLFQQKYMMFQQMTQKYQDYASAILLSKVNGILKNISDKGSYDLVLTSNQLVYVKPKYDLTDQVIEQLKSVDSDSLVKQLNNADKQILQRPNTQSLQNN